MNLIFILALYSFVFLGTEFVFDERMALFVDAAGVVTAQNYILGASVIGFVLYPFVKRWTSLAKRSIIIVSLGLVIAGMVMITLRPSYEALLVTGIVTYILFGMWGSFLYHLAARAWVEKLRVATAVGASYALGVGLQFVCNNFVENVILQMILLALASVCMFVLANAAELQLLSEGKSQERTEKPSSEKLGILLIAIVVLMAFVFSTLDNAVTLAHADGDYDIGQFPRILLAVSGLLAGFLFDIKKRRYMYLCMYCITVLSVIGIILILFDGYFLVGLLVFYLSAGSFVVFFTTAFLELSYTCKRPDLWAGLGRGVNNACAIFATSLSLFLLNNDSPMQIMVIVLLVLVVISACVFAFIKLQEAGEGKGAQNTKKELSEAYTDANDKFAAFAETYRLTEREKDVMSALLQGEEKMQDIATNLSLSRTALYRHVARINEKTNTKNRISLIQFFHKF